MRITFAAVLLLLLPATALARPPLLPAQQGCELWLGQAHGNDPSVRVNLRLCPTEGGGLSGELQWSSLESGHNVRAVVGSRQGDKLILRDERIVEEHPEPGWRFCTIERYELTRSGSRLTGTYHSRACNDEATVELSLITGAGTGAATGTGTETGVGTEMEARTGMEAGETETQTHSGSTTTETASGCACRVESVFAPSPIALLLVLVPLLIRRRARG